MRGPSFCAGLEAGGSKIRVPPRSMIASASPAPTAGDMEPQQPMACTVEQASRAHAAAAGIRRPWVGRAGVLTAVVAALVIVVGLGVLPLPRGRPAGSGGTEAAVGIVNGDSPSVRLNSINPTDPSFRSPLLRVAFPNALLPSPLPSSSRLLPAYP